MHMQNARLLPSKAKPSLPHCPRLPPGPALRPGLVAGLRRRERWPELGRSRRWTGLQVAMAEASAQALAPQPQPGDALMHLDGGVQVHVTQPTYAIRVEFRARSTALQGATRIWAHMGHSGWRDTLDVELSKVQGSVNDGAVDHEVWHGTYRVLTGRMPAPWHLEAQLVFKGLVCGHERWENNGGANWTLAVEVAAGEGLVQALNPTYTTTRATVSSLVVRLESLVARRHLTPEQGTLLRTLAWQRDMGLIKVYQSVQHLDDPKVAGALAGQCSWLRPPGLNVVHIASEMAPIAKVGGLGDVVMSLAKAHQAAGTLCEVILPKYDCIHYGEVQELRQMTELDVPWGPLPTDTVRTVVWGGVAEGLPVYLIEPHSKEKYFWRGRFYGEPDDAVRFCFFSRAALEFLARRQHEAPDVVHVHDWQAAAVGPLLKETYRASPLSRTRCVLTIHNLAFQGIIPSSFVHHMGLAARAAHVASQDVMLHGDPKQAQVTNLSLLKGGIVYSDRVTTVSPTYAQEVLGPQLGMGLNAVLNKHKGKFLGVLNGIDHETWSPLTDLHLPAHFSVVEMKGKNECKQRLLAELGLPTHKDGPPVPLLAVVSRLTEQKGLPLILAGLRFAVAQGAQVVVLGGPGDDKVRVEWEGLAREYGSGGAARIVLRHDEALSHRIFAAADMLLVPSMFEPCGLTQLIALRYGTIPIVRETGGLADTVRDVAHSKLPEHLRNGFTFAGSDVPSVETALRRALQAYRDGQEWWQGQLVPRAMSQDWSWTQSAQQYLDLYRGCM